MAEPQLSQLIKDGYMEKHDLSCSETILYGANQVYDLGLDEKALHMAAGFGAGMGVESVCGALTGGIMVLGVLFVDDSAHENNSLIYDLAEQFLTAYQERMGEIECRSLRDKYYNKQVADVSGCREIILTTAEVLEEFIAKKS